MNLKFQFRSAELTYLYSRLRSVSFASQYFILNQLSQALGLGSGVDYQDHQSLNQLKSSIEALLQQDSERIESGVYPASVLYPDSFLETALRLPKVVLDTLQIAQRRSKRQSQVFSKEAQEELHRVPPYYRRNFHFQSDGYLSSESAEAYDYEVELLFSGAADAMRRLILAPLKEAFPDHPQGEGLRFLEMGSGTGRATRFLKLIFPQAQIVALDLSEPYLKVAMKRLKPFKHVSFIQGDAAHTPFQDHSFDAVISVFLYHELPRSAREDVLRETYRVLKPNGLMSYVDSLQLGDTPELDALLKTFPKNFHEPYYMDYIKTPLEELISSQGFGSFQKGVGFLSQYGTARKLEKQEPVAVGPASSTESTG